MFEIKHYLNKRVSQEIIELLRQKKNDKIKKLLETFDDADLINVQKDDD